MIHRWLMTIICVLLCAGCASTSSQVFPKHYTLLAAAAPAPAAAARPANGKTLRVARVAAPAWLDGTDMYYRLDYRNGARLAAYGSSQWAAPPPELLEQLLQSALVASHAWRAVIGPGGSAQADVSLHIRLEDFIQIFASPQQSDGVLDGVATLVNTQDGAVIGQKTLRIKVSAPSADAAGGVRALNRASHEFSADIVRWLGTIPAHSANAAKGGSV